mgnify:CR=1 FL=1
MVMATVPATAGELRRAERDALAILGDVVALEVEVAVVGAFVLFDEEPAAETESTGSTRKMPNRKAAEEPTVESPTIESPLDSTMESPTMESPIDDIDGYWSPAEKAPSR